MTPVTLPVWLLAATCALPTICLFWLIGALMIKKRKTRMATQKEKPAVRNAFPGESQFTPFHEDLHLMQIDAVFDGLSVLIETERLKLKRMINGQMVQGKPADQNLGRMMPEFRGEPDDRLNRPSPEGQNRDNNPPTERQIEEIASRLGVSAAETELAMKFRNLSGLKGRQKLEAVA